MISKPHKLRQERQKATVQKAMFFRPIRGLNTWHSDPQLKLWAIIFRRSATGMDEDQSLFQPHFRASPMRAQAFQFRKFLYRRPALF